MQEMGAMRSGKLFFFVARCKPTGIFSFFPLLKILFKKCEHNFLWHMYSDVYTFTLVVHISYLCVKHTLYDLSQPSLTTTVLSGMKDVNTMMFWREMTQKKTE